MNEPELTAVFRRIEPLADRDPGEYDIRRLPGYTNDNYHLENAHEDWVLRIPRAATNPHIDRRAEALNQHLAVELGIAPRPVWRADDGLSLTPTIRPGDPVEAADLRDPAQRAQALEPLRRLHRSGKRFQGRLEPGPLIERYEALLPATRRVEFATRLRAARLLWPLVQDRDAEYVPSHGDPVLENLLVGDDRVWLIDWEFSAMASPCWDLAILYNAARLDYAESRALLTDYCADGLQVEESLLFDYRNLLQLLSDCWMAALVESR